MLNPLFRLALLICLAAMPVLGIGQTDKQVIDQIVATVGGEIILLSEVEEQIAYARQQQPELPENYNCAVLQNLIVQKLLVNQAKLDSIEVKDEEVETQLNARVDRLMLYFNQDTKALEEYYGQTVDDIKNQLRTDMRNQLLAERMQGEITGKASITPMEVRQFFDRIPTDSLPYFNSEVEIREIVYKPKVNSVEHANARTRIDEIRRRIADGEDFAALAKKYSDDPSSGAQGGDLGFQKRGTFVPAFEAAAYKLERGQLSPVVESEFGFHIIQLLERRGNLIHARHILIKPEITDADLALAENHLDSVRQMVADSLISFTEAVKRFGDKNVQSYNNDGRMANPRSGNTFFEVADLETDVYFAIEGLQIGQVTKPIPFKGPDGERYFRIVQLVSRSKPHRADLKLDYNRIQQAALDQKKALFTEKWVLEKLKTTHLGIRPMFARCANIKNLLDLQARKN